MQNYPGFFPEIAFNEPINGKQELGNTQQVSREWKTAYQQGKRE
jgi:hypothetical protein